MKKYLINLIKIIYVFFESLLYLKKISEERKNILLIRLDNLGDLIISIPTINEINKENKSNLIILLEECKEIFELYIKNKNITPIYINKKKFGHNFLYRIKIFREIRKYQFNIAINLQSSSEILYGHSIIKSCLSEKKIGYLGDYSNQGKLESAITNNWYTSKILVQGLGAHEIYKYIELLKYLGIKSKYQHKIEKLKIENKKNYVVISPGSSDRRKTYESNKMKKICQYFMSKKIPVIILGSKTDIENSKEISMNLNSDYVRDLTGKTSIREAVDLINKSYLFVGMDSALAHLATLMEKKSIILVGGGHENRFFPYPIEYCKNQYIVRKEMSCYGCNWHCIYKNDKFPCISEISEIRAQFKINEALAQE